MSDSVFIKSIHIREMFGLYDFNIHIPEDHRVSLLTGPNGSGKTKILETIYRFCRNSYTTDYPVKRFNIVLSDKTDMNICKRPNRQKKPLPISPINPVLISPETADIFPLSAPLDKNISRYSERYIDYMNVLNGRLDGSGLLHCSTNIDHNLFHYTVGDFHTNICDQSFSKLSSGHKWLVQLWYQILFSEGENRLLLIDTPETLMHICIQETFLDDLIEMCEKYDMRAIVVTHSPYIVSSHANLVLNKNGPRYKRPTFGHTEFKNV
jgi:ABC-type cobalamin/Fe3+-siderophores transport system ATPase subunit